MKSLRKIAFLSVIVCLSALGWAASARAFGGFIENRGQVDQAIKYYALGSRVSVYFTDVAVVFDLKEKNPDLLSRPPRGSSQEPRTREHLMGDDPSLQDTGRGCTVYLHFEGADPSPVIEVREELVTTYNYFLGSDPSKWRTGVPAYREIVYHDLWPGVDVIYREDGGNLVYKVAAAPGADREIVRFGYAGTDRVTERADGTVLIETSVGSLSELRAVPGGCEGVLMWGEADGVLVGPTLRELDNPGSLLWSTFLGGNTADWAWSVVLDESGNPLVTGQAFSSNFPTTAGAYDPSHNGDHDAFVAKLSASGSDLLWCTFLGGSSTDAGISVALDTFGNPVVCGHTYFTDASIFPTTPGAYDTSHNGWEDGFVAKLSASGSTLIWSTFLGGSGYDYAWSLALDTSDNPVVSGWTSSSDFPATSQAYDTSYAGAEDVFVTKLSASGSTMLWSTFLGGSDYDDGFSLVLDASDNPVITGLTGSYDFPATAEAHDTSYGGYYDAFVTKLAASGSTLLWSTFLGADDNFDCGRSVVVDASDNPIVTGTSFSSSFPTTPGAYDTSHNGASDVFVAKFSTSAGALIWSTFLGGSGYDEGCSIVLDPSDKPVVTGFTGSYDFPMRPGAYDTSYNGGDYDVYVAELSASGNTLLWSTFLGGSGSDQGYSLVLDASGDPVIAGQTSSGDFPTTPTAYDTSYNDNGYLDAFVAKLSLLDESAVRGPGESTDTALLCRNAPNPFRTSTAILVSLTGRTDLHLRIYDGRGRLVRTLAEGSLSGGTHALQWDGLDENGKRPAPGIYFVSMEAGSYRATKKVVLLR